MIQVFNQRAHAFDLSVQILALLLLCAQLFLTLAQIVLQAHLLILNHGERLLQVNNLELCFAPLVLRLSRLILAIIDLGIELCYLLPSLADVFLKCGIIALHSFELLLESQDFVLLELRLGVLLLKLPLDVALLVLKTLNLVSLTLNFFFSLQAPLHPGLDLERILLKQGELLHQLVFLSHKLLIID